jgi:serine/threonine-protein phosphatase 5
MESTSTSNSSFDSDTVDSLEKSVYSIKLGDINYEDSLKLAEEYKDAGNKLMQENKLGDSINKYTDAINLNIETGRNAIYYSNRAWCHNKLENFGLALTDASKAIEIDKNYDKAYFRRASANLFLFHYDEAIKDLMHLFKKYPNDELVIDKLKKAQGEVKKKKFFDSISEDRSTVE